MTHCIRCHRPMKQPTESGLGRVCAKRVPAPPVHERDLFGYDVDKAAEVARIRVATLIDIMVTDAKIALRHEFRRARVRLGVWSA